MAQQLGSEWRKSLLTFVDNKTLIDPDLGAPMKLTRGDMLGIARHVGNESNFDKLTKGWGWDGATVMKFLNDNMTEKDWQATAFEWKQAEHYWPQIEAQARRLGGVPPEKIPLRAFDTKFGKMEGGYAPISYHPERSKLVDRFNDFTVGNSGRIGEEQPYRAATTFNGSTQNRASGYTDKVDLGFHSFEVRLRDTVHDLAYHEVLLDLSKITNHPEFREQFQKTFGKEQYGALKTFLTGVRDMNLDDNPNKTFERWVQYSRKGMVMTATGYRISTILKHVGSEALKTFGYLGDGAGAKYFAARVARMATGNAGEDIAGAMQKFPEIAARSMQFDRDYREGMKSLYHDESVMAKNERFGHAFIATMDKWISVPTAWAAYDRAVSEGIPKELGGTGEPMSEQDAVNYANKIVRESHGTATEVSRSNFMQSRGAKSLLATIYQFGNNTKGQLDAHLDQLLTGTRNKAQVFGSSMAVFLAPALMAGWVAGDFDDKTPWWKSVGQAVTGEIAGTVPLVREIASAIVRQEPDKIMEIPALKPVADAIRAMIDAYKEAGGHSTRLIKDAMNAVGELFHIAGLGQAATSIQYLKDVQDGKQDPKNAKDFVTGVTIGPPPKH